jgi:geranylgeranyl diphosphate synthase type II
MHAFSQLARQFEDRFIPQLPFPTEPANLYEPCRYLLALGGKRIRPVLCLMANELFGDITEDAWHAAHALELFHNFTLIHDDIMDKAPVRRGHPTIHEKYGMTAGILSGDVMCIWAYESLAHIRTALPQVLQLFNRTAMEVCEGQQLDMDYEQRTDVSIDQYLHMISLKTSVLVAASLKTGAILGGATEGNADKLYEFGRSLGIAFQLQDDYLDAFGDAAKLGKQNGGDIRENKKTYLLLKAMQGANEAQSRELERLLATDSADKVPAMLQLFQETGADKACRDAVAHYSNKAFDCLDKVAVISKRKQPLLELAQSLLGREF